MPYEITIDYPNMPKGAEVAIPGLDTFKNGDTNTVTDEQAAAFRAYQVASGGQDKTLLQSFQGNDYVTVSTAKTDDQKKDGEK